ncbi:hypothetical protein Godav_019385 [Gossypium davidsonii]|uniref:Uncharacterized protein n=1 Tax=Gossypium davidsonii TaxID=34287 RepID=A0A7J8QZI8_GOSDV|nr:hypothetical protein [Gossypium davidsonii]
MSPLDSTCWIGGSVAFSFLNHGRYFGHCVDVVHLLQQLTICNCVLEGVKSLALLHNLHLESAFYVSDASEGWNCVCYTVVSLVKTLPVIFCIYLKVWSCVAMMIQVSKCSNCLVKNLNWCGFACYDVRMQ